MRMFICAVATVRRGALLSFAAVAAVFHQNLSSTFAVPFALSYVPCVPFVRSTFAAVPFALLPFLTFQTFATFISNGFEPF